MARAPRVTDKIYWRYRGAFGKPDEETYNSRHTNNLICAISVQNARYLDWKWNGGTSIDADAISNPFRKAAARRVAALCQEARSWLPGIEEAMAKEQRFEFATRMFIIGLSSKDEYNLSEHCWLSELQALPQFTDDLGRVPVPPSSSFRIKVPLMKSVQLLRYRLALPVSKQLKWRRLKLFKPSGLTPAQELMFKNGIKIKLAAVLANGEGVALGPAPSRPAELSDQKAILKLMVSRMKDQGLFSNFNEVGDLVHVFHKYPTADVIQHAIQTEELRAEQARDNQV